MSGKRSGTASGRSGFDRWSRGHGNARARLSTGLVVPESRIGFSLTPETRVFALGACFARRLEAALLDAGIRVTSVAPESSTMEIRTTLRHGLLNQDSPNAILQELEWASGKAFPIGALLPFGDEWVDPFLRDRAPTGNQAAVMARRNAIGAFTARAFKAEVVLIALGHTEVWYDGRTKQALNGPPHPRVYEADRDRFGIRRIDYEEVFATLRSICQLLKRRNARQRIVLTVSPVPMERTFSGEDIIVANMTAKTTLHAAATAIANTFNDVDYFPCFEAVMASDPARAWMSDRRNVTPELVSRLVAAFIDRYGLRLSRETRTEGTA
jgi:hypothetical protein